MRRQWLCGVRQNGTPKGRHAMACHEHELPAVRRHDHVEGRPRGWPTVGLSETTAAPACSSLCQAAGLPASAARSLAQTAVLSQTCAEAAAEATYTRAAAGADAQRRRRRASKYDGRAKRKSSAPPRASTRQVTAWTRAAPCDASEVDVPMPTLAYAVATGSRAFQPGASARGRATS